MNQQPDKIFREKLESFSKPVPAKAWNRVEARLTKKNHRGLWLKAAASILLLAVAAILLWPADKVQTSNFTAQNETGKRGSVKKEIPAAALNENQPVKPVLEQAKPETKITPGSKRKNNVKRKKKNTPVRLQEGERIKKEALSSIISQQNISIPEEVVIPETAETTVASGSEKKEYEGVTLIYTVEEVNAKYLDKKSLAEATPDEKKPSTLKKLLNKAYVLKQNQDTFGDLRQKKNEILALNFRNEKQRSQNK